MTFHRRDEAESQLIAGLVIITIGVLFLLDQFDVIRFSEAIRIFWPLFLIWIGVSKLIRRSSHRPLTGSGDHDNAR
jgi:hypothetical protein